jgi:hypothetical protein
MIILVSYLGRPTVFSFLSHVNTLQFLYNHQISADYTLTDQIEGKRPKASQVIL